MKQIDIKTSSSFKAHTIRAIGAIIFFIFIYILILLTPIALTLVLIFLLKFLFRPHKKDLSHLHEITRRDEPQLFNLIEEIVNEVGTRFPKKVYLNTFR